MKKLNRPTNLENPGVIEHEKITRPTNLEKTDLVGHEKKSPSRLITKNVKEVG